MSKIVITFVVVTGPQLSTGENNTCIGYFSIRTEVNYEDTVVGWYRCITVRR